jgi:hypothetical protein
MSFPLWQPVVTPEKMMVHPETSFLRAVEGVKTGMEISFAFKKAKMAEEQFEMNKQLHAIEMYNKRLENEFLQSKLDLQIADLYAAEKMEAIKKYQIENQFAEQKMEALSMYPSYADGMSNLNKKITKIALDNTNPINTYLAIKGLRDEEDYEKLKVMQSVLEPFFQNITDPDSMFGSALNSVSIPCKKDIKESDITSSGTGAPPNIADLVRKSLIESGVNPSPDNANAPYSGQKQNKITTTAMTPIQEVLRRAVSGDEYALEALNNALSPYEDQKDKEAIIHKLYGNENDAKYIIKELGNLTPETTKIKTGAGAEIFTQKNIPEGIISQTSQGFSFVVNKNELKTNKEYQRKIKDLVEKYKDYKISDLSPEKMIIDIKFPNAPKENL